MKIKAMGSDDVRRINKGDTAGGLLPELPVDLVFDKSNYWTIDSKDKAYANVPKEWFEYLVEADREGFQDVTEMKRVPANDHQKMFLGAVADPRVQATEAALNSGTNREVVSEDIERSVTAIVADAEGDIMSGKGTDKATAYLEAENAKDNPRSTLVSKLEALIASAADS